jgi:hypothetical protein
MVPRKPPNQDVAFPDGRNAQGRKEMDRITVNFSREEIKWFPHLPREVSDDDQINLVGFEKSLELLLEVRQWSVSEYATQNGPVFVLLRRIGAITPGHLEIHIRTCLP